MTIAFAFEYLLRGYARKDVIQVPMTLASMLRRDWCYITRPTSYAEDVGSAGSLRFVGRAHSADHLVQVESSLDSAARFTYGFAVRAGLYAAVRSDFFITMFLTHRAALASLAYRVARKARFADCFVYHKADFGTPTRQWFEAMAHGGVIKRLKFRLVYRLLVAATDLVSVESDEAYEWLVRTMPDLARRTVIVRNCPAPVPTGEDAPPSARGLRMIAVSRLGDPSKGADILLAAFRRFHEYCPEWDLVLVGPDNGNLREILQAYTDLIESGHVRYEGFVGDAVRLAGLYGSATLFVLPSRREGSPLSLIEAIRAGCLPICTPVLPLREILGDLESRLTVPIGDPDALCESMLSWARNPESWGAAREYLMARTAGWRWNVQLSTVADAYRAARNSRRVGVRGVS